nr:hypothetical protein [Haladaptatus salinisoli]
MDVIQFDQRQEISFQFTANELDVTRFSLVVDYSSLLQFWEMGMVKCDPDALSLFVGHPFRIFVSNPVCNAIYERIVCQCFVGCIVHCVEDGASMFVRYYRQNRIGGDRSLTPRRIGILIN